MGVDWYSCKNCGNTFPDCGDYVSCECGEMWCSNICAEEEGYIKEEYTDKNGEEWDCSCGICRGEIVDNSQLLDFALKLLKLNKDELIQKLKENDAYVD